VDTGELVVDPGRMTPPQLPRLNKSVDATGKVLLLVSVQATRRIRDGEIPVALAKEQRMSVMLTSERMVPRAS
jgi:hypothetical protein